MLPVWGLKTSALLNGVLTVFGVGAICQRLCEDLRSGQVMMVVVFAAAILILVFAPEFLNDGRPLGNPSTDWPSSLLTLYVYSIAFRLVVGVKPTAERWKLDLFLIFVGGAIATTFKLSQAPVALALGVASLSAYLEDRSALRGIIAGAGVASIAIVLWILHGVGLSGCLLYPLAQSCFRELPWTVAAEIANSDAAWIKSWARVPFVQPEIVLANWDWLPKWWSQVSQDALVQLIGKFYVASVLCVIARVFWKNSLRLEIETLDAPKRWMAIGLQGAAIIEVACWFFAAPDPRFGYGFLIVQSAMLFALMFPVKHLSKNTIPIAIGDYIGIQDADLEYDPLQYRKLLVPLLDGRADVVFGSRYLQTDNRRVLYFWHTWMNTTLTAISNAFTNLDITDMETCYKLFKKEIIQGIELKENRFGFEPEVTAKVSQIKCRVYECAINYTPRTVEEGKKINWKDGVHALYCILHYGAHAAPLPMQILLYFFIGVVCAIANVALFSVLTSGEMNLSLAIVIAFVVAAALNYYLCVTVLFRHRARWTTDWEILLYLATVFVMGIFDYIVTMGLFAATNSAMWSKVAAVIVGFFGNFLLRRYLVFPERTSVRI